MMPPAAVIPYQLSVSQPPGGVQVLPLYSDATGRGDGRAVVHCWLEPGGGGDDSECIEGIDAIGRVAGVTGALWIVT
jgi:hypothetical protein